MANGKKLIEYTGEEISKVDVPTSVNSILVREICEDVFDGVETVTIDTYANDIPGAPGWGQLNVVWLKEPRCTISFDANGGTGTMNPLPANIGIAFNVPTCKFTKYGFGFNQWAIGSVSGPRIAAGSPYAFSASTTLYAIWDDNWEEPILTGNKLSATQFNTISLTSNKVSVQ